ncbi:MAG: hypothetical protein U0263_28925 [Polyangiaceae bacterium]
MSLVELRRKGNAPNRAELRRFLPTSRAEMDARGIAELDILIVTGDAYVDHPAFGPVLIARFLEARGFRVGIVAQPRWDTPDDLLVMGRPRLFVGVSAGNLDGMLNKLTHREGALGDISIRPDGEPNSVEPSEHHHNLCSAHAGCPSCSVASRLPLRRPRAFSPATNSIRCAPLHSARAKGGSPV